MSSFSLWHWKLFFLFTSGLQGVLNFSPLKYRYSSFVSNHDVRSKCERDKTSVFEWGWLRQVDVFYKRKRIAVMISCVRLFLLVSLCFWSWEWELKCCEVLNLYQTQKINPSHWRGSWVWVFPQDCVCIKMNSLRKWLYKPKVLLSRILSPNQDLF